MREMVKKDMDSNLDNIGNGYRLCILGYLNEWIGGRTRAGITGGFGVPGENDNGRRVMGLCEKKGTLSG